jgi:hypothetical protein
MSAAASPPREGIESHSAFQVAMARRSSDFHSSRPAISIFNELHQFAILR